MNSVRATGPSGTRNMLSVREGQNGIFTRHSSPSQRRTQRRAARRRVSLIGENQRRYLEEIMKDTVRRDAISIGVYALDYFIDAVYRETTQRFQE